MIPELIDTYFHSRPNLTPPDFIVTAETNEEDLVSAFTQLN